MSAVQVAPSASGTGEPSRDNEHSEHPSDASMVSAVTSQRLRWVYARVATMRMRRDSQCDLERVEVEDVAARGIPTRLLMERQALYVLSAVAIILLRERQVTLTLLLLGTLGTAVTHSGVFSVLFVLATEALLSLLHVCIAAAELPLPYTMPSIVRNDASSVALTPWVALWYGIVSLWVVDLYRVVARTWWVHQHTLRVEKSRSAV